ncbi:major facilitator superfamily domain-containing protein 7-b [Eurytemora carolleeae]|uniref:major facilitator superfamily domain-containing protein 7-b n=1 Tax=Eurytemora carolleeae TaxID=1294199 RepID=UPI000C7589D1|nr:major facilitator superfamily domain-containing protein 7-b [Eurytemora carolleeae]|eukprot:XP_023348071.1 major facilitator superfamily domain-containing protein 7-b-like [Eurytemora affinis]
MEPNNSPAEYILYKRRWFILGSLAMLNLSNNALWISYSAVADVTAEYFKITADEVDLLGTISFMVGIPMCLVAAYITNTFGLKTGIYAGSVLTLLGGGVRALSTLPGLNTYISLNWQYYLSLAGQALTGMGNPFAVSLPTKVSQNWFGEKERIVATGVLAMSLPLGIVLGQGCSPIFVRTASDVPVMNLVWFGPAVLTQILVVFAVTSSNPPTPACLSSKLALEAEKKTTFKDYLIILKTMMCNIPFLVLFLVIGGAVGFFNAFSTQLSQLMCSRGYDNISSGIAGSLLLGTGFVGATASGILVEKYGYIEEISKVFYGIAGIWGILIAEFMRKPDSQVSL